MRSIRIAATVALFTASLVGCSRNNIEAVNLANEKNKRQHNDENTRSGIKEKEKDIG